MNQFNHEQYVHILRTIKAQYILVPASQALSFGGEDARMCILRHDIDYSLDHALNMARLESELGIQSTYYFLLDSNWYNLFNQEEKKKLKEICALDHQIGLHYHAINLMDNKEGWRRDLHMQKMVLENLADRKVESFSYHCPGVVGLDALDRGDTVADMVNCYSLTLQDRFVYRSDSLRKFKDPDFIANLESGVYENLHLLIHPILWQEKPNSLDGIICDNIQACQEKLINEWDVTKKDYKIA